MKGFALILGFLVLEAAFLWQAAAPLRAARAAAPAPLVVRGAGAPRGTPCRDPAAARGAGGVRFPTPTFAAEVEGRRGGLVPRFPL